MTRIPQCPIWAIYRAASKTVWLGEVNAVGEVEATDEAHAIAEATKQFKVPASKLIAVKRT